MFFLLKKLSFQFLFDCRLSLSTQVTSTELFRIYWPVCATLLKPGLTAAELCPFCLFNITKACSTDKILKAKTENQRKKKVSRRTT